VRRTITCVAAAAALALAGPARADVYDDNPAAASRANNDVHLLARGPDGTMLWRHFDGTAWSDWASLGGSAASGPAAAPYGSAINAFMTATDGAVYQDTYVDGSWHGWVSLGGGASSAPAAEWRKGPLNYFDVAIKGLDNAIWFETYVPGHGWSGWSSLGGNLTSAPALVSQADGIVNVFARGADCTLYQRYWDGSKWSDWLSLGGCLVGAPTVVSRAPNVIDVYARGVDNATWQRHWDINGWAAWTRIDPGRITSAPAATADNEGREFLFARGGTGLLAKAWTAGAGWTAWADSGPVAVPAPPPAAPPPNGEVYLQAGLSCTPAGGLARVTITIRKKKGAPKPRVSKIVFFTKGKGRAVRVDSKAPWVVHIKVNRPAGSTGRVYARVYFRRSKHGKLHHKTVSRRYSVCR
jgi:hypothetical protein